MQISQVEEKDLIRLEKCQHCGRKIRPGQVVLVKHGWDGTYSSRDFAIHARCMKLLLETAPPEQDQLAYEELRDRILVTGNAFPEE